MSSMMPAPSPVRITEASGRLPPARRSLRGPPPQAQGPRRRHQPGELHPALLVPPSHRDPPAGLDPGPPPRRHHHRLEPGQNQGPPQPQPTRPRPVTPGRRLTPGTAGGGNAGMPPTPVAPAKSASCLAADDDGLAGDAHQLVEERGDVHRDPNAAV